MIVKIENEIGNGTYCYFEADSITQAKIIKLSIKETQEVSSPDTIFLTSGNLDKITPMINLTLYKKHKSVQWVITNHRTYLMNDDGKTIDKLF